MVVVAQLAGLFRRIGMRDELFENRYLTERQAAYYLGFSPITIRQSRWTGTLAGLPAPAYVSFGRSVRYTLKALEAWVARAQKGACDA
tara:strand:- start:3331 stop:3594 length:264 start_codon:yes stop_codon:yes gene_type:complete